MLHTLHKVDGSTDTMWSIQDAISTKLGCEYADLDQESRRVPSWYKWCI